MDALIIITWIVIALSGSVIMVVAVTLWLREVLRSRDGATDERLGEPSPVDGRAVPFMVLAGVVSLGVLYIRGEPLLFRNAAFAAVFIGFALSAGWYLLARRSPVLPKSSGVQALSTVVAACFGALSGLAVD
jgi:hypothetical protein